MHFLRKSNLEFLKKFLKRVSKRFQQKDFRIYRNIQGIFLNAINPFVPNAPFLYPLKTSENHKVFWCFQGVKKGCIGNEWVNGKDNLQQLKVVCNVIWSPPTFKSNSNSLVICFKINPQLISWQASRGFVNIW